MLVSCLESENKPVLKNPGFNDNLRCLDSVLLIIVGILIHVSLAANSQKEIRKMLFHRRQTFRVLTACILVATFPVPPSLLAQIHIVSRADLQREPLAATQARQHNLETVRQFL